MILQLFAWKPLLREQTARFIAFCAALSVVTGVCVAIEDQVQAQTVRPLQGTLVMKVPRGLLSVPGCSEDYWLYVNGQIVSAPPRASFEPIPGLTYLERNSISALTEWWDNRGVLAGSEGGRFTYMRPGIRERLFQERSIHLAPGSYIVELLTRAEGRRSFPFAAARMKAQIVAGKTEILEFGVPDDTKDIPYIPFRPAWGNPFGNTQDQLDHMRDQLDHTVQNYESDPIVPVLNKMLRNLRNLKKSSHPGVFADLPASMGGGRYLDEIQVSRLIKYLEDYYKLDDGGSLHESAKDNAQQAGELALRMIEHNRNIALFHGIVEALEDAKK